MFKFDLGFSIGGMKCVLLLRCETWRLCLLQYFIPTLSENAQQCQFLLNWVCYKSSASRRFLMPTMLLSLYLITTLLGCSEIKILWAFIFFLLLFYCSCLKPQTTEPNSGKSSGLVYDFLFIKNVDLQSLEA